MVKGQKRVRAAPRKACPLNLYEEGVRAQDQNNLSTSHAKKIGAK